MANNRMFLKCECGKKKMIAKHYADPWKFDCVPDEGMSVDSDLESSIFVSTFNEWCKEHFACGKPTGFSLEFEGDG